MSLSERIISEINSNVKYGRYSETENLYPDEAILNSLLKLAKSVLKEEPEYIIASVPFKKYSNDKAYKYILERNYDILAGFSSTGGCEFDVGIGSTILFHISLKPRERTLAWKGVNCIPFLCCAFIEFYITNLVGDVSIIYTHLNTAPRRALCGPNFAFTLDNGAYLINGCLAGEEFKNITQW